MPIMKQLTVQKTLKTLEFIKRVCNELQLVAPLKASFR